jgi:excinuclease ABC subunit A
MTPSDAIVLKQVTQHNLRIAEIAIPMHRLVGVTGPSGSGKSSLVIHTLYAESQRRYLSSLSTYQRQFFEKWAKPAVEEVLHVGASLLVGPKNQIRNARATVATTSGLYPLLCDLYAQFGQAYCPMCDAPISYISSEQHHPKLRERPGTFWAGFPMRLASEKHLFHEEMKEFLKQGLDQVVVYEGTETVWDVRSLLEPGVMEALRGKEVFFVLLQSSGETVTLAETEELHRAIRLWSSRGAWMHPQDRLVEFFALEDVCAECGSFVGPLLPDYFSFYSSLGSCPDCHGFGAHRVIDPVKISEELNTDLSLSQGFFYFLGSPRFSAFRSRFFLHCQKLGVALDMPWRLLSSEQKNSVLYGRGNWKGLKGFFDRLEAKKYRMTVRIFLNRFYSEVSCERCQGTRLSARGRKVVLGNQTLPQLTQGSISQVHLWFEEGVHRHRIPEETAKPFRDRLNMLKALGLGYLTLNRKSKTLSGGEVQRLSIVHHIGTELSDTLYVMDEPSIGLHPRDCQGLLAVCRNLANQGNHVVIIEHDETLLRRMDHIVELGPGSGKEGGQVVWEGPASDWQSVDQRYPSTSTLKLHTRLIPRPYTPRLTHWLEVEGAKGHNLKNVSCRFPLQCLVGVCGVSGSGKTSLLIDTVVPFLQRKWGHQPDQVPLEVEEVTVSPRWVSDVHFISQSLPVRSSRANLLTFTAAMDVIRKLFAALPAAKSHRFQAGHFSFNSPLGQCPTCRGAGQIWVEMVFMEDLCLTCDDCHGQRFKAEVLEVRWRSKSILDVLNLTVDEAAEFFADEGKLRQIFSVLKSVGLGYLVCGQSIDTFSGGELQRLKIAEIFLNKMRRNHLYVLDEPSTGLHAGEIRQMIYLFFQMIQQGHSVIVIEHHPEVLAQCDYLVELGPGGGEEGGQVIFQGPPADLRHIKRSPTAPFLK